LYIPAVNLHRLLVEGRLRPVTARAYRAAIAVELELERVADRLPRSTGDEALLSELTVLVKTFERPAVLRRLVDSIRRFYPELRVVVVDDSRKPQPLEGVETVTMPYDSGVSAGRNELIRHADTRYILLLDDDFVFYRHTRLAPAVAAMEAHREIDIMGGQVVNLPFYRKLPVSLEGPLYPTHSVPRLPIGSKIGEFEVAAKVPVFFVARRERVALVPWDPGATRSGHADFFTRAWGVLTTVYNPQLRCLHAKTPFAAAYMAMRLDLDAEADHLAAKYGA
jgi:Glycosyl transferase family 2